jgi:quercetin dioxygenase-like cupin family protein
MRLFKIEPSSTIPTHKHPWEHEIYVVEGEGEVEINGVVYKVREGDAIYIPPEAEHSYRNSSGSKPFRFICLVPNKGNKTLMQLLSNLSSNS